MSYYTVGGFLYECSRTLTQVLCSIFSPNANDFTASFKHLAISTIPSYYQAVLISLFMTSTLFPSEQQLMLMAVQHLSNVHQLFVSFPIFTNGDIMPPGHFFPKTSALWTIDTKWNKMCFDSLFRQLGNEMARQGSGGEIGEVGHGDWAPVPGDCFNVYWQVVLWSMPSRPGTLVISVVEIEGTRLSWKEFRKGRSSINLFRNL